MLPFAGIRQIVDSPKFPAVKARCAPSGDQAGTLMFGSLQRVVLVTCTLAPVGVSYVKRTHR